MSDLTGALAHKLVRGSEIFPLMSAWGSKATFLSSASYFWSTPITGHRQTGPIGPFSAITRQSTPMKPSRNLVLETGALQ
jgi:hypothetical protein